jgi:hypothetical protein
MQLTKRRLTDLWVVGRELTLDDGGGDPITVWLQKMNAIEAAEATRRSDAARAKLLASKRDDEAAWHSVVATVTEYVGGEKSRAVDFLLLEKRNEVQRTVEARFANEEEWSKDNYLQGLYDAWSEGLEKRWLADGEDDPEAANCKVQLDRFAGLVNEEVDNEIDLLRQAWTEESMSELQERMAEKLLDMDAGQAWMSELFACQIFYGIREPDDHKQRYFTSREEVNDLAPRTFEVLRQAYVDLEVDVAEGKGLPAPTSSSPSSEEQNGAVTEPSSGQTGADR